MPSFYRYEWTSPKNGMQYRLDIAPADDSAIDYSSGYDMLNDNAIEHVKTNWAFDTYPYGLCPPVGVEIKFRMKNIPNELKQWIANPQLSGNTYNLYNASDWTGGSNKGEATAESFIIELGTIYNIYAKPAGGTTWGRVYVGIQDMGERVVPDFKERTITIKVEDALRATCRNLKLIDLDKAFRTWVIYYQDVSLVLQSDTGCSEFVWQTGSDSAGSGDDEFASWIIGNVVRGEYPEETPLSRFWFTQRSYYYLFIARAVTNAYRVMIRDTSASTASAGGLYSLLLNLFDQCRKQTYDTSPIAGDILPTNNLNILGFVANTDTATTDSEISYTIFSELATQYTSIYDYIADITSNAYFVSQIRYDGSDSTAAHCRFDFYRPLGQTLNTTVEDITELARDFEVQLYDKTLQNVTTSTAFAIGDDVDKYEYSVAFSRGKQTITIPVVHSSSPVAGSYETTQKNIGRTYQADLLFMKYYSSDYPTARQKGTIAYGYSPRMLGFYYRDNPERSRDGSNFNVWNELRQIRVHSFCNFLNDGETNTPPSDSPVDPLPQMSQAYNWQGLPVCIAEQARSGTMQQLATKFGESFHSPRSTTITGTLPLLVGAKLDLTGDETELLPFSPYLSRFALDLTAIDPDEEYLEDKPSEYWVVSCESELTGKEENKVTLWGK